jgi:hypothetical protein
MTLILIRLAAMVATAETVSLIAPKRSFSQRPAFTTA